MSKIYFPLCSSVYGPEDKIKLISHIDVFRPGFSSNMKGQASAAFMIPQMVEIFSVHYKEDYRIQGPALLVDSCLE